MQEGKKEEKKRMRTKKKGRSEMERGKEGRKKDKGMEVVTLGQARLCKVY